MKANIKQIHTISELEINVFNKYVSSIVKDMQMDNLEVEVQYQYQRETHTNYYTALIIGRGN